MNNIISGYVNNGTNCLEFQKIKNDVIIEGFWDDKNRPICGNYHDDIVIDKLNKINEFMEKNMPMRLDYQHCRRLKKDVDDVMIDSIQYLGYSHCRLCDKTDNGDSDVIIRFGENKEKKITFSKWICSLY